MSEVSKESDDSDNESLPDLVNVIAMPCSTSMSKGDIVWAKYGNLYWPALVRSVYDKEKKVSVWFTDDPGKTFKLPFKSVCSFYDGNMRHKIEKDAKEAGCFKAHEGLTSHAISYLKRKADGYVDDPLKFFDQRYPFYLLEEFLKKNPGADVNDMEIPPLYLSHEKKSIRKSINVQQISTSNIESDLESVTSDEESTDKAPIDYLSKLFQVSSAPQKDDNILECVKSGKADDYLEKILTKSVPSKYRDAYEREIKCNEKDKNSLTYTGPIKDDKQLSELIFYLLPLYNKMTNTKKSKHNPSRMCKSKVLNYPSSYNTLDKAQYIASVWLPEAIIYAMSDVYNVSLKEAEQLFEKKSELQSSDVENIFSLLDSEATMPDSKVSKKRITCQNDNIQICSPFKKMCLQKDNIKIQS